MLGNFNDEQLSMIYNIVDPKHWGVRFKRQTKDVELVKQVHTVLNDITTVISKFQQQTHEISDAVSQQASVAEEVSRNVENVRLLTDDTVESSSNMSESLAGLKTNSDALTTVVKQFKV